MDVKATWASDSSGSIGEDLSPTRPDPARAAQIAELEAEIRDLRVELVARNAAWRDVLRQLSEVQDEIGTLVAGRSQTGPIAPIPDDVWSRLAGSTSVSDPD